MIVTIFGPSCVGKSSVAKKLASDFMVPLRACGAEVRSVASALGIAPENLTDNHHHQIDAATIEWISKHAACIVEGRFLDHVLAQAPDKVFAIQLTAIANVRLKRACERLGKSLTMSAFERIDKLDDDLRHRLYGVERLVARISFDTSNCSVEECVTQLKTRIHEARQRT